MTTETNDTENSNGLLLLHLSDIHFQEPYCLNLERDPDHPVRTALLNDIHDMVEKLGAVDTILVSGDIAFKGHTEEYRVAAEWLTDVANVAGCHPNDIYTVPGNHDVNRASAEGRSVLGTRGLISQCEPGVSRDRELHKTLLDEKSGPELFTPMEEYNLFAASYECDLNRERPSWIENLPLAPGWTLKMHGLTTTFLSGPDDDKRGDLYLGALQRSFSPDDGVVHLAMMHHPPDWLGDQEELDDALWEHCALQLLGHKHRQRYHAGDYGVRLAAAAVNPDRTERDWKPGYNLIKLQTVHEGKRNILQIESYLRIWQESPDRFVAKKNGDGGDVFSHGVPLRRSPLPDNAINTRSPAVTKSNVVERTATSNAATPVGNEKIIADDIEGATKKHMQQRDIVFHFWELSPSQRRKIMQDLDLLEPDDDILPEPMRYRRAFERARRLEKIADLEIAINRILGQ